MNALLDLPHGLLKDIFQWTTQFSGRVDEIEELFTANQIWKGLTVGVGIVSAAQALQFGFSGPMLQASGVSWDLRKTQPYERYDQVFSYTYISFEL